MSMSFIFLLTVLRLLGSGDLQNYDRIDLAAALPAEHIAYLRIDTAALHKDIEKGFASLQQFPVVQMSENAFLEALQSVQINKEAAYKALKNTAAIHLSITAVTERGPRWMIGLEGPFDESLDECLAITTMLLKAQGAAIRAVTYGNIDMQVLSFGRREGIAFARHKHLLLIASSLPQLKNVLRGVQALERKQPRPSSLRNHLAMHGLSFPTSQHFKQGTTQFTAFVNSQLINQLVAYEEGRDRLLDDTTLVDMLFDTEALGPALLNLTDQGVELSLSIDPESNLLTDLQAHAEPAQLSVLQSDEHFISSVVRLKDSGAAVNSYMQTLRQMLQIMNEDDLDEVYEGFEKDLGVPLEKLIAEIDEAAFVVRSPEQQGLISDIEHYMQQNFSFVFQAKSAERLKGMVDTMAQNVKQLNDSLDIETTDGTTFISLPKEDAHFAMSGRTMVIATRRETCQAVLAAAQEPLAATEQKPVLMTLHMDLPKLIGMATGADVSKINYPLMAQLSSDKRALYMHLDQSLQATVKTLANNMHIIIEGVKKAQENARWTQSMNNMRQIVFASIEYRSEKGSWPNSVDEAIKDWGAYGQRLKRCPASGNSYTYIKPVSNTSKTLVLYSAARPDGTHMAAFADAHVEILSADDFAKLLKATKEERAQVNQDKANENSTDDF